VTGDNCGPDFLTRVCDPANPVAGPGNTCNRIPDRKVCIPNTCTQVGREQGGEGGCKS